MARFFVHFIKRFYELEVFERESLFTRLNAWMTHKAILHKQKPNAWMTHRGIPRKQKHNSKKVLLLVYKKVVFTVCVCLMHKALVF